MNQKIKERTSKMLCILMVVTLALGMVPMALFAGADDAHAASTANLQVGQRIEYAGYSTNYFDVDGNIGYCSQPSKATPPSGAYTKEPIETHGNIGGMSASETFVALAMYYSYGGPGFDASMWPSSWYDGTAMSSDRYIALSHILIADVCFYDSAAAMRGCNGSFVSWCTENVLGGADSGINASPASTKGQMVSRYTSNGSVIKDFVGQCFMLNTGSSTQFILSYTATPPAGDLELYKSSANPSITNGNSCYSLAGATYSVTGPDGSFTLTTDASGYAHAEGLTPGEYVIQETKAPKGYALDTQVHKVTVGAGGTAIVRVSDRPQNDPARMYVGKFDGERTYNSKNLPQGSASLAGAEYTVKYYAGYYDTVQQAEGSGQLKRTWVVKTNENGVAALDDAYKVSGDAFFKNNAGQITLPLGTVTIQETKAPEGYLLGNPPIEIRQITPQGNVEIVDTFNPPASPEQVIRGDVEFVKVDERTQKRLAGIPFTITSKTTGESHVVVTDENGAVNTAASWNAHTSSTNRNDDALAEDGTIEVTQLDPYAGIWFGTDGEGEPTKADDSKGALPYDTYILKELRCEANKGLDLVTIEFTVKRNAVVVDLGSIDDQQSDEIHLSTSARDGRTDTKELAADPTSSIIDRVEFSGLVPDATYKMAASLHDAVTGDAILDASGDPVTASKLFVSPAKQGWIELELAFDSRDHAGERVVVFEELRDPVTDEVLADHADKDDFEQSVDITVPSIATQATDAMSGGKQVANVGVFKIDDEIAYKNLIEGETYVASGVLMLRSANGMQPVLDDAGEQVTSRVEFVATEASGSVTVPFEFAGFLSEGDEIVVYETVLRAGKVIATHEDPEDEGQTVTVVVPSIKTRAVDAVDGNKNVIASAGAHVLDTISYENLVAGAEYTVSGTIMVLPEKPLSDGDSLEDISAVDPADVTPLLDADGDPVTASATFTASAASGEACVEFAFDASALADKSFVVYEKLALGDTVIATHEDPDDADQSFNVVGTTFTTEALSVAEDHFILTDSEALVNDLVFAANISSGEDFETYGLLFDPLSGIPASPVGRSESEARDFAKRWFAAFGIDEGYDIAQGAWTQFPRAVDADALQGLLAEAESDYILGHMSFAPESESAKATMTYDFDARELDGVALTSIVMLVKGDVLVYAETDLGCEAQTVALTDSHIATQAHDGTDGDQQLLPSRMSMIVDTVAYDGLKPGREYTLRGYLYDKATGKVFMVNDMVAEASKSFVPSAPAGEVDVEFLVDTSESGGADLVVFEYLYLDMVTDDGRSESVLVAEHADIESAEQTVHVTGDLFGDVASDLYDQTGFMEARSASGVVVGIVTACILLLVCAAAHAALRDGGILDRASTRRSRKEVR